MAASEKLHRVIAIGYGALAVATLVFNIVRPADSEYATARWVLCGAWAVLAVVHVVQARAAQREDRRSIAIAERDDADQSDGSGGPVSRSGSGSGGGGRAPE